MFNFFKKKNNILLQEDKLYSKILYQSRINTISLIYFSDNYYYQALEFLQSAHDSGFITKLITYNDNDEDMNKVSPPDNTDIEAYKPEDIKPYSNYIILSGNYNNYYNIFNTINSLSNELLLNITESIIYKNFSSSYFYTHISNGILSESKFKYKNIEPQYSNKSININKNNIDNINDIINVLPKGLTKKDILELLMVESNNEVNNMMDLIYNDYSKYSDFEDIIKTVCPNMNLDEFINYINTPRYMDNVDIDTGVSNYEIDEMFTKEYDNFTGMYDDIEFKNIDEISDEKIDDDNVRSHIKEK